MGRKTKHVEEIPEEEEEWFFECSCHRKGARCKNYDDGEGMIECETCGTWTHTRCNKIRSNVKNYTCGKCTAAAETVKENTKEKKKESKHDKPTEGTSVQPEPIDQNTDEASADSEPTDAWSKFSKNKQKETKRKVVHNDAGEVLPDEPAEVTEYEKERLAKIEQNKAMLASLGIQNTVRVLREAPSRANEHSGGATGPANERKRRAPHALANPTVKTRVSRRLRGSEAEVADGSVVEQDGERQPKEKPKEPSLEEEHRLLTLAEYYEMKGIIPGAAMDGHYRGWVNSDTQVRCGIADTMAQAWEQGGGGKFSFKLPPGVTAKENARRSLRKNPNSYFYRHCEPGDPQWQGNWTHEEISHFVKVAEEYGCGDKWGLFSSHIPHRVGYQCSAIYRQVIIPNGLLTDPNFKITSSGTAVWAPTYNKPEESSETQKSPKASGKSPRPESKSPAPSGKSPAPSGKSPASSRKSPAPAKSRTPSRKSPKSAAASPNPLGASPIAASGHTANPLSSALSPTATVA